MSERICVDCGKKLEVLKNGFKFILNGSLMTSDLWGCRHCERFQIHGIPSAGSMMDNISVCSDGEVVADPANDHSLAILDPILMFHSSIPEFLRKYYPHWDGVLEVLEEVTK